MKNGKWKLSPKTKKKIIKAVIVIIIIFAVCFAFYMKQVAEYKNAVANLKPANVDVTEMADGIYKGECNVDMIRVRVAVTVQDGKIASVELLEHYNGRGAAAESIPDEIVKQQRVDVDAVTGATNSSKVIEKAVENALTGKTETDETGKTE